MTETELKKLTKAELIEKVIEQEQEINTLSTILGRAEFMLATNNSKPKIEASVIPKSRDGIKWDYHCGVCDRRIEAGDSYCKYCGAKLLYRR